MVDVDGAPLALRMWGPEDGRPLFFWHALGPAASGATIAEVAPVLARRGFRVCAVDGPGFGASPLRSPDRYELEPLLDLVDSVLDELGWTRAAFVGHSWGGAVGVLEAGRRPERVEALVLLDSGHIDYGSLPDVDPELSWEGWLSIADERTAEWPSLAAFEQDLREGLPRWSDAILECFLPGTREEDGRLVGSPPEARAAAMRGLAGAKVSDAWPAIAAAGIPTLLLLAEREPWAAQEQRTCAALPGRPSTCHDRVARRVARNPQRPRSGARHPDRRPTRPRSGLGPPRSRYGPSGLSSRASALATL